MAPTAAVTSGSSRTGSTLRRPALWTLVALLVVGLFGPALGRAGAAGLTADEKQVFDLLNRRRTEAGVMALPLHEELMASARAWAAEMARQGQISHSDPPAGTYWRWSENVGAGGDAASIQQGFNESSSHDHTTIDNRWTHVGVGAVWRDGLLYVVQQFGTYDSANPYPSAPPSPPSTPSPAPPAPAQEPAPVEPATPPVAEPEPEPTATPVAEELVAAGPPPLPPAGAIDALYRLRLLDAAATSR